MGGAAVSAIDVVYYLLPYQRFSEANILIMRGDEPTNTVLCGTPEQRGSTAQLLVNESLPQTLVPGTATLVWCEIEHLFAQFLD